MRRAPAALTPPTAEDHAEAVRRRLERLRGLAQHVATLAHRERLRAIRDVCEEAAVLLPPFAWLLPYSLSILLARHVERPTCRLRRAEFFGALLCLAEPQARGRTLARRPERPRYSIGLLGVAHVETCESRHARRVCGAPAVYGVAWTWRRGRVSKPLLRSYCEAHGRSFAKARGLVVPTT